MEVSQQFPILDSFSQELNPSAIGNRGAFVEYSTVGIMQTYPQLFGFNTNVYEYFVEQYNLCGYNLTLSYPSTSPYPTLRASGKLSNSTGDDTSDDDDSEDDAARRMKRLLDLYDMQSVKAVDGAIMIRGRQYGKRDTTVTPPSLSPTGVIDPLYQCRVLEHLEDYAKNFTVPWSESYFYPLSHKTDLYF
jgi:carboxypeptidase D